MGHLKWKSLVTLTLFHDKSAGSQERARTMRHEFAILSKFYVAAIPIETSWHAPSGDAVTGTMERRKQRVPAAHAVRWSPSPGAQGRQRHPAIRNVSMWMIMREKKIFETTARESASCMAHLFVTKPFSQKNSNSNTEDFVSMCE